MYRKYWEVLNMNHEQYVIKRKVIESIQELEFIKDHTKRKEIITNLLENVSLLEEPVYIDGKTTEELQKFVRHDKLIYVDDSDAEVSWVINDIYKDIEKLSDASPRGKRMTFTMLWELLRPDCDCHTFKRYLLGLRNEFADFEYRTVLLAVGKALRHRLKIYKADDPLKKESVNLSVMIIDLWNSIHNMLLEDDDKLIDTCISLIKLINTVNKKVTYDLGVRDAVMRNIDDYLDDGFTEEGAKTVRACIQSCATTDVSPELFVAKESLTSTILEDTKHELQSELDIILSDTLGSLKTMTRMFMSLEDIKPTLDQESLVTYVLYCLEKGVVKQAIKRYGANLTFDLQSSDIFKIVNSGKIGRLVFDTTTTGSTIYYSVSQDSVSMIAKDESNGNFILIKLVEDGRLKTELKNFMNVTDTPCDKVNIQIKRIKCEDEYEKKPIESVVTEGIEITEDGGIKFIIDPKKSFMDEYAETHRILHNNLLAGNYEAMKTDLAYLFAFINHIESQVLYKSKSVKASKREDAMKARMFAINDFKTYLKKVQEVEPTFDFSKYYSQQDTRKVLFQFKNSEIKGVRKLLRAILHG